MKIKEHPEWSQWYPAIDGIARVHKQHPNPDGGYSIPKVDVLGQNAIRSDIEDILTLHDKEFESWYNNRKNLIEKYLKELEIMGSVPDLSYASEKQKLGIAQGHSSCPLGGLIGKFKKGLDAMEKIKQVRDEMLQ